MSDETSGNEPSLGEGFVFEDDAATEDAANIEELFERNGLPLPPLSTEERGAFRPARSGAFATRGLERSLYEIDSFIAEVEARPDLPPYAAAGFAGYGVNSWGVHCYAVDETLALFVQLRWGGAYGDVDADRRAVAEAWRDIAALREAARAKVASGVPAGRRLLVVISDFGRDSGWAWLPQSGGVEATVLNEGEGRADIFAGAAAAIAAGPESSS